MFKHQVKKAGTFKFEMIVTDILKGVQSYQRRIQDRRAGRAPPPPRLKIFWVLFL